MSLNVLYAGRPDMWDTYAPLLARACAEAGLDVTLSNSMPPEDVDYMIFATNGLVSDFTPYTRTKAVLSLWAGVETIVTNTTLTQPLTRMVDVGLAQGMSEWVAGHALRHHLGTDLDVVNPTHEWTPHVPPLAADRQVAILGMGALGQACAKTLRAIGFPVIGWSRTQKTVPDVECLSGSEGLDEALSRAQIVVTLLPFTAETENTLNARTLSLLPRGAFIINPGRGPLIDDEALLAALDSGQIGHATLDVFRVEPLPADHPYWQHPNVTVTPHIAADTRPRTAAQAIAQNIRRSENGEPLLHLVDRQLGY